jgi:hypothetical protein
MDFFIVVHHRNDPHQPWVNSWVDDDRIEAIQTTNEIGQHCLNAKNKNQRVFVHRCGWGHTEPTVCCNVEVDRVDSIDKKTCLVRFCDPKSIKRDSSTSPVRGQNYYFEKQEE